MKKEAKNKLTCDLDLWYYNTALVINQGLKPGSKYVLINYKECGSLRSPTPCLCIDFILCIYCMEGYCVHGTSVPVCSMNNKQWFKGQVYSKLSSFTAAAAVHNLDLVI